MLVIVIQIFFMVEVLFMSVRMNRDPVNALLLSEGASDVSSITGF